MALSTTKRQIIRLFRRFCTFFHDFSLSLSPSRIPSRTRIEIKFQNKTILKADFSPLQQPNPPNQQHPYLKNPFSTSNLKKSPLNPTEIPNPILVKIPNRIYTPEYTQKSYSDVTKNGRT